MARPRSATPRVPIRGYPFDAAVEVELRCENSVMGRLRWKGGDPVRGDVLTFFDESGDDEAGHILTFLGSGSYRSRHSPLYVLAPARHVARTSAVASNPRRKPAAVKSACVTSKATLISPNRRRRRYAACLAAAARRFLKSPATSPLGVTGH